MIVFLNGRLAEKQPTRAVLDVGGVGHEVLIPLSSYDQLPAVGETCHMLVFDYVREDTHALFGFMSEAERHMFTLLMGVSGIGPKLALSALSGLSVRDLKVALVEGDVKRLSSISGIGRKVAERLVVELRDKIGAGEALEALAGTGEEVVADTRARDAIAALTALGYKRDAASKMVMTSRKALGNEDASVETLIKHALSG